MNSLASGTYDTSLGSPFLTCKWGWGEHLPVGMSQDLERIHKIGFEHCLASRNTPHMSEGNKN